MKNAIRNRFHFVSQCLITSFSCFYFSASLAIEVPIYDFPITAYSQNANDFFKPDNEEYSKTLLSTEYQSIQLQHFYNHYYANDTRGLSPWSEKMVMATLPLVQQVELEHLEEFNNQNKSNESKHFAKNFKEHDKNWWNSIRANMDIDALVSTHFMEKNRAIAVANTYARLLPDSAPDFFHFSLAGEGFPFDNLQVSAIWVGTPLYVFSTSKDKAWSLALTPDGYFSWVKSSDIAYVSTGFITQWQKAAQQNLIAVTQTEASIISPEGHFQFTAYIGAVFPMQQRDDQQTTLLIPVKNNNNQATIKIGVINSNAAQIMPLAASPKNFVMLINQLKNRPYGWGGIYFLNDCAQELKSLFTPFGIWLPRNSAQQSRLDSMLDLSKNTMDERLNILGEEGRPFMTLIYVDGHVMLYLGKVNLASGETIALTYQNLWGLTPENRDKRYVIGQSLFFPLLTSYPENSDINPQANKSRFKLIYLDTQNLKTDSPNSFVKRFLEH